jgi:hypothetical protein
MQTAGRASDGMTGGNHLMGVHAVGYLGVVKQPRPQSRQGVVCGVGVKRLVSAPPCL